MKYAALALLAIFGCTDPEPTTKVGGVEYLQVRSEGLERNASGYLGLPIEVEVLVDSRGYAGRADPRLFRIVDGTIAAQTAIPERGHAFGRARGKFRANRELMLEGWEPIERPHLRVTFDELRAHRKDFDGRHVIIEGVPGWDSERAAHVGLFLDGQCSLGGRPLTYLLRAEDTPVPGQELVSAEGWLITWNPYLSRCTRGCYLMLLDDCTLASSTSPLH